MSRDLVRRLRGLERAMPAPWAAQPSTDRQRALFLALRALPVAMLLGGYEPGDDPMDALYRGIEKAHAHADRASPYRYRFIHRLADASAIALNGCDSVAVPLDWAERCKALLKQPGSWELLEAFSGLRDDHADLTDLACRPEVWTVIGEDGVERYRWPERAGGDRPPPGWRGQGMDAAAGFWAIDAAA